MREAFVGFDSAWTDNRRNPGAICALVLDDEHPPVFYPPRLATFDQAANFVLQATSGCDYALVAIDQPTVVPNEHGSRPVERVAASLISKLKGGVQPARRSGSGAAMFGDEAPIWRFLDRIGATQDPQAARGAATGLFAMEVFPALALPAIVPAIWERGHGAKYNPRARLFRPTDWPLVCLGVGLHASVMGRLEIARCAEDLAAIPAPSKADQDRLDALICLTIALGWRHLPPEDGLVLGDPDNGHIVTPVSPHARSLLVAAAARHGVPVDGPWTAVDRRRTAAVHRRPPDIAGGSAAGRAAIPIGSHSGPTSHDKPPARARADDLRHLLTERAKTGSPISYGEVAAAFGYTWSQGFGASLKVALQSVDAANIAAGEPRLMCLVVNAKRRTPGEGFFELYREGSASGERRRELLDQEVAKCTAWPWG